MSSMVIQDSTLTNMADAIKNKDGLGSMTLSAMPSRIANILTDRIDTEANLYLEGIKSSFSNSTASKIRNYAFYGANFANYYFDNVISVGQSIFGLNTTVANVQLPKAEYIGSYAFESCRNMYTSSFPKVKYIGTYVFVSNTASSYYFPEVTELAFSALANCSVRSVYMPQIVRIGASAFNNSNLSSSAFTEGLSFSKLASIDNYCFKSYKIPFISCPELLSVGYQTFANCTLLSFIDAPKLSFIGGGAFLSCYTLTSMNCPDVTYISSSAFYSCTGLTNLSFSKLTYVGSGAFANCINLGTITLGSVSYIGLSAFLSCRQLSSVYLLGSSVPSLASSYAFQNTLIWTSSGGIYGSVYVPSSLYSQYIKAKNWSNMSKRITSM